MYRFWCLLCADRKGAEIKIQSLDEVLRESIGQFSIINFTLTGFPSSICSKCHVFLKELEVRKERYSKAEQMFLELLKMRNKAVDIEGIRAKYKLSDTEDEKVNEPEPEARNEQFLEFVECDEDKEAKTLPGPTSVTHDSQTVSASLILEDSAKSLKEPVKRVEKRQTRSKHSVKLLSPKLLNPTTKVIRNLSRINLFSCDLCPHRSSTKRSIERHIQQIHIDRKGSRTAFQCETCLKTFSKKTILQSHAKIHMIDRPTFECPECGKLLSSPTAVSNHIKWMHKDKRDFKCSTCSKVFATKGSLSEHQKIHSDYKGHVCPICKKTYKTASILVQHLDTHGETEYHCTECGLRLNSKRTLRQHMLKHSNDVRHKCAICLATFKRTKTYKEHLISLHTDLKAYSCDWCEKTFANGANCRKHKKEVHPHQVAEADRKKTKKPVRLPNIDELLMMSLETSLGDAK